MIEIIDNFLDDEDFNQISEYMQGDMFPWYLNKSSVYDGDGKYQLIHCFFNHGEVNSSYLPMLNPIFNKLNIKDANQLKRVKANMSPKKLLNDLRGMHVDFDETDNSWRTAVYYLNTNDGKTIFSDSKEVQSVANRIVIFPTHLQHSGVSTTDTDYRMVLNLNWVTK